MLLLAPYKPLCSWLHGHRCWAKRRKTNTWWVSSRREDSFLPEPMYMYQQCAKTCLHRPLLPHNTLMQAISTAAFNFHTSFQWQREKKKLDIITGHQKFQLFFPKIAVISVTYIQQIRENICLKIHYSEQAQLTNLLICYLFPPLSLFYFRNVSTVR